jgi:hypothetical protein
VVRVNFALEQAVKTHRWNRFITLSLTSALDTVGVQHNPTSALYTVPIYKRMGGPEGRSRRVRKISPLRRFDSRTLQLYRLTYPSLYSTMTLSETVRQACMCCLTKVSLCLRVFKIRVSKAKFVPVFWNVHKIVRKYNVYKQISCHH